jgi:hypothetical protein
MRRRDATEERMARHRGAADDVLDGADPDLDRHPFAAPAAA